MARQTISAQKIDSSGVAATYTTIGIDGVEFSNAKNVFLHLKATTAATITIPTPITVNSGLQVDERVVSLGAGEDKFVGPFSARIYEYSDGTIRIDSDQTDTDVAALRIV